MPQKTGVCHKNRQFATKRPIFPQPNTDRLPSRQPLGKITHPNQIYRTKPYSLRRTVYKRYTNVYKKTTHASVERSADTWCVQTLYTKCVGNDSLPLVRSFIQFSLQDPAAWSQRRTCSWRDLDHVTTELALIGQFVLMIFFRPK